MNLFEHREAELTERNAPLAARMRPRTIDEYVGQDHIMAPGRLLRRAIEADQLTSLIFYGPPGTGKTTLARVIANRTEAHFTAINAVLAGVKDLREAIASARRRLGEVGQRTVLFIDEVHRFNKAQQDALLPWVERGTVILVGATTENPYFEVNKALVSRSRIFQLETLAPHHLHVVLQRALDDPQRGYGARQIAIEEDARAHLVSVANGDARSLLGALELAVETTAPGDDGTIHIDLSIAEESIQRRAVLYDKEGDAHFDIISAFIKSMRGSDPDASLYWLARMVYAGEDPRFIFRRLLIFASEDVGLAAPEAIAITQSLAATYDRVGMPEGRYHLSQATLYLATAPKSNSTMGFFDALAAVKKEREADVPVHLKDGTRDSEGFGHGKGYLYPHAYRDHWVAQQYLPDGLQGRLFYTPSRQGHEAGIHDQVMRRRDAQLAAMVERDAVATGPIEILTNSPEEPAVAQWMARTLGDAGERLGDLRDRLFDAIAPARHDLILDLRVNTGLLLWEALRRVPEGGVWGRCEDDSRAEELATRAERLPDLRRPQLFGADLRGLPDVLIERAPGVLFDRIVGRGALLGREDAGALLAELATLLRPKSGRVALLEAVPERAQRLVALREDWGLDEALITRWRAAEEAIYADPSDPMLAMGEALLTEAMEGAGLSARFEWVEQHGRRVIGASQLDRWFPEQDDLRSARPSYAARLSESLDEGEVSRIASRMRALLTDEVVTWRTTHALCVGSLS